MPQIKHLSINKSITNLSDFKIMMWRVHELSCPETRIPYGRSGVVRGEVKSAGPSQARHLFPSPLSGDGIIYGTKKLSLEGYFPGLGAGT